MEEKGEQLVAGVACNMGRMQSAAVGFADGGRSHKPRNMGSPQEPEKAKK